MFDRWRPRPWGRLTHLDLSPDHRGVILPPQEQASRIAFPDVAPERLVSAALDGVALTRLSPEMPGFDLPPGADGQLTCRLAD
ncbi:MAG: hypothetical protein GDA49_02460 [Rhodospirillales bacterium]|nr:hypothetical protein [Rhodospirillales bacterium]